MKTPLAYYLGQYLQQYSTWRRLRCQARELYTWLAAVAHLERPLYRKWKESGGHNSGYAAVSGVVVLPPSVRAQIKLPSLLLFIPDGKGGFYVTSYSTVEALNAAAAEPPRFPGLDDR